MDRTEIAKLVALEDTHWWYRERRHLVQRVVAKLPAGVAVDIGAAGGGNTRVLKDLGWRAVAMEYDEAAAQVAKDRKLYAVRGDAQRLPFATSSVDLIVSFDVLEHLADDVVAVEELRRILRPGGTALIAVPADMSLWSAHDTSVGHVRRYERTQLVDLFSRADFSVVSVGYWNVLLRPAVKWHRRKSSGSDLQEPGGPLNAVLGSIVKLERWLPVQRLKGVSLVLEAKPLG